MLVTPDDPVDKYWDDVWAAHRPLAIAFLVMAAVVAVIVGIPLVLGWMLSG